MVLPPSPADAGAGEAPAWLSRIARLLEVSSGGKVIILVTGARPESLRMLARALLDGDGVADVDGDLRVLARAPEIAKVPLGALVVLAPGEADLDWLNLNRPVFSERALRVILWADDALTAAMKARAPDFFDWISHVVWCPERVADFAVAGLRSGAGAYPGVAWRSGDLDAALARAHPVAGIHRAPARARYPDLVRAVRDAGDRWLVWTGVDDPRDVVRIRWALAEADRSGPCVIEHPACPTPAWWPVHGRCVPLAEAAARLGHGAGAHAALVAALLDLEPGAIELATRMPALDAALREHLARAADPGAELARAALARGVIDADDVVLDRAPDDAVEVAVRAPVLRATRDDPAIASHRQSVRTRVSEQLAALQKDPLHASLPDAAEILVWAAARPADAPPLPRALHVQASLAPWMEALLRAPASIDSSGWSSLYRWAMWLGHLDAAGRWERKHVVELEVEADLLEFLDEPLWLGVAPYLRGTALRRAGRYDEAEEMLREALPRAIQVHGNTHPLVAHILEALGMVLSNQGRHAEAEEPLREAIAVMQRVHGSRIHASMLRPLSGWGLAVLAQGRFAEAEEALREALSTADALGVAFANENAWTSRQALGAALLAQDRPDEARDVLRPGWEHAVSHGLTAWAVALGVLLATALERTGEVEEAGAVRARTERLRQELPPDEPVREWPALLREPDPERGAGW